MLTSFGVSKMTTHVEQTAEMFLETADGLTLFVREWAAKKAVKNAPGILIVHGLGEHSGRYVHVAQFLNEMGFVVRTYDHRGHGQSGGGRGDINTSDAMLRDMRLVVNDFTQTLKAPPLILAHSMGGLFATHFVLAGLSPVRGLILSSPALTVKVSPFQRILFELSKRLIPHLGVGHGTRGIYLSHDIEVVREYQNDPLVHNRISASLFAGMLNSMAFVRTHAKQLRVPLLLLVADDDVVVDPQGSRDFLAQVNHHLNAASVSSHFYAGFYHEVMNEIDSVCVFDDIRSWLDEKNFLPSNINL